MQEAPKRVQAVLEELDRTAADYTWAKDAFQDAQVRFEAAREKFAGVKQLATAILPPWDWWRWESTHPEVRYAAMPIGEAILAVLRGLAYQAAVHHLEDRTKPFHPWALLEQVIDQLDKGGFDFRSATPLREVNAALIRLEGVQKHEQYAWYTVADLDEVMRMAKTLHQPPAEEK